MGQPETLRQTVAWLVDCTEAELRERYNALMRAHRRGYYGTERPIEMLRELLYDALRHSA